MNKIKNDKQKLNVFKSQLEELQSQEDMLSGIRYDTVKVQTSGGNPIEESVERIITQREKITISINEILKRRQAAEQVLYKIKSGLYQELLYRYYFIGGTTFEELADKLNYTPEHTRVLHTHALDEFQKHLTESYKKIC